MCDTPVRSALNITLVSAPVHGNHPTGSSVMGPVALREMTPAGGRPRPSIVPHGLPRLWMPPVTVAPAHAADSARTCR